MPGSRRRPPRLAVRPNDEMQATQEPNEAGVALRQALEAIPGVRRALLEGPPWRAYLICEPGSAAAPVEASASAVFAGAGHAVEEVELQISFVAAPEPRRRVRLAGAALRHPRAGLAVAEATLEWRGAQTKGEAEGVSGPGADLRVCALATLHAVKRLVPTAPEFHLVGVKQVRVFDRDLLVALMRVDGGVDSGLLGACLARADVPTSVAAAVLNGLNRVLGNYLSVGD